LVEVFGEADELLRTVPVNASAKKGRTRCAFPRNDASDTSFPDVDAALNSGATAPTCGEFCSCVLVIAETNSS
jgi:hypothetical protein